MYICRPGGWQVGGISTLEGGHGRRHGAWRASGSCRLSAGATNSSSAVYIHGYHPRSALAHAHAQESRDLAAYTDNGDTKAS
eukprot:4585512-Pleurochrysis_carterae.AAC.1